MDFKKFYILRESPEIDDHQTFYLDDEKYNTSQFINLKNRKFLQKYKNYDVYLTKDEDMDYYYFSDDKKIVAYVVINSDNGISISDTVWRHKDGKGQMLFDIMINFILHRYPFIECYRIQSTNAKNMWIKLLKHFIALGYRCTYLLREDRNRYINEKPFINVEDFESKIEYLWSSRKKVCRIYNKKYEQTSIQ